MSSDRELLSAWQSGNKSAGEALFARHAVALLRFFRNKVDVDVEDLIQRTFLAAVEFGARFEGRSSFRAFLFGIARNVLFNHFRGRRTAGEQIDFEHEGVADLSPGPSTLVTKRAEEGLLVAALRALPLASQVVLELYYWEDMTAGEIAEALDEPEGTIRTRLRTARRRLEERVVSLCHGDARLRETATDLERWAAAVRGGLPGFADRRADA